MKCQGGNKYALPITVKFDQSTGKFGRISFARLFKLTKHIALLLAWAWLAKAKGHSCHTKKSTLAKHLRKKTSKSAKHACHYATKERSVKITMYLGLDIIIKIKFTTIFDRCAILNVLNYLTKNFES